MDGLMVCLTDGLIIHISDGELMAKNMWIVYIHRWAGSEIHYGIYPQIGSLSDIYELDIFMDGLAALYIFINGLMVCVVYIHRWAYYTCISENGLMVGNIYPQIGSLLCIYL
jgi:hypothetical protein